MARCRSPRWSGCCASTRSRSPRAWSGDLGDLAGHAVRLSGAARADGARRVTPGELLDGPPHPYALRTPARMELPRGRLARLNPMPPQRGLADAALGHDPADR